MRELVLRLDQQAADVEEGALRATPKSADLADVLLRGLRLEADGLQRLDAAVGLEDMTCPLRSGPPIK